MRARSHGKLPLSFDDVTNLMTYAFSLDDIGGTDSLGDPALCPFQTLTCVDQSSSQTCR